MKKLMFAAALALGATCFAESIESNVVGYQTYDLKKGYNTYAPVFESVNSASELSIQDIKLVGSDGGGVDLIRVLDDGNVTADYSWMTTDDGAPVDGWYNLALSETDENFFVKDSIPLGKGIYVYISSVISDVKKVQIQLSGSVKLEPLTLNVPIGYTMLGNSLPVPVPIQNVKLNSSDGGGVDLIRVLDDGNVTADYSWMTTGDGAPVDGWYNLSLPETDENFFVKDSLQPGQGLYLYVSSTGLSVTFSNSVTE